MKNKLIIIGYIGLKRAYLNISKEEAVKRYISQTGYDEEYDKDLLDDIREIEFNDEFGVYDAWK
jgi:hypothetical protein